MCLILYMVVIVVHVHCRGCQVGGRGVAIMLVVVVIVATVHCAGGSEGSGDFVGGCDSGHCTLYKLE